MSKLFKILSLINVSSLATCIIYWTLRSRECSSSGLACDTDDAFGPGIAIFTLATSILYVIFWHKLKTFRGFFYNALLILSVAFIIFFMYAVCKFFILVRQFALSG